MQSKLLCIIISIFTLSCNQNRANIKNIDSIELDSTIRNENDYSRICIPISKFSEDFQKEIVKYKNLQDSIEVENIRNQYKMTEKDIEVASKMIYECLVNNGFKPIQNDQYKHILNEYFHISLESECPYVIKHKNYFTYLIGLYDEDINRLNEVEYDYTYEHIFFLTNYNIISYLPLIGDFIENLQNENIINQQTIICIPNKIIHRNKYLFNNNQASLTWLINNDLDFLEILVREFGYDKESKINKAILDKIYKEYQTNKPQKNKRALQNLFVKRDCSGNLQIRQDLLKFISDGKLDSNDSRNIYLINQYISSLWLEDYYGSQDSDKKFTDNERFKIMAYLTYYEQLYYDRYQEQNIHAESGDILSVASFLESYLDPDDKIDLQQNLEENNYYNLPSFKEIVERILLNKAILRQG